MRKSLLPRTAFFKSINFSPPPSTRLFSCHLSTLAALLRQPVSSLVNLSTLAAHLRRQVLLSPENFFYLLPLFNILLKLLLLLLLQVGQDPAHVLYSSYRSGGGEGRANQGRSANPNSNPLYTSRDRRTVPRPTQTRFKPKQ